MTSVTDMPIEVTKDEEGFSSLPNLPVRIGGPAFWGSLLALNLVQALRQISELQAEVRDLREKVEKMEADE